MVLKGEGIAHKSEVGAVVLNLNSLAVQNDVLANLEGLDEIEINPLLCCPSRAIAADALLIRKAPK